MRARIHLSTQDRTSRGYRKKVAEGHLIQNNARPRRQEQEPTTVRNAEPAVVIEKSWPKLPEADATDVRCHAEILGQQLYILLRLQKHLHDIYSLRCYSAKATHSTEPVVEARRLWPGRSLGPGVHMTSEQQASCLIQTNWEIHRKWAWKLHEPFPLDSFLKTNRKLKGNRLGSSWDNFL